MKKCIAFLLCFLMVFSLFSCSADDKSKDTSTQDKESTANSQSPNTSEETTTEASTSEEAKDHILDKDEEGHFSSYESILEVYRMGINHFSSDFWNQDPNTLAADLFGTEDTTEKEWFLGIYSSATLFSSHPYKLSLGYAIKDLNGDGVDELVLLNSDYMVIAIFSMADEKPVLLANYIPRGRCWIDGNGWLHENGSNGADRSTNATYKIAKGGASLELIAEFGTNGHEFIDGVGVTKYYQLVNGEKVDITEAEYHDLGEQHGKYLGLDECAAATKEYAALTFTPLFTEAEIAMEMYEAAINDEICVIDEHLGEIKLKACRFPSDNTRLDECKLLTKAILDLDGDGVSEYVIQSETKDQIVLRYYDGKVYSYCFDRNHFYNLNTDGSFYWSDSYESENWFHGCNQITFNGASLNIKEIYRIKHTRPFDFYENLEFYVDSKQLTSKDFSDYNKYGTLVIFSPLDISCEYPISSEKACELASNYWEFESGMSEGAAGTHIVNKIVMLEKPNSDTPSYRICWQGEGYRNHVPYSVYSLLPESVVLYEEIFVNAFTGEITSQVFENDIAMQMYDATLGCDIKVYDTNLDQFIYLKDCKTPYNQIPLDELSSLNYAYTDMDQDGINELVIDCGDTLILRYYDGTVYLYSFTFRNSYYLNTDGSYSWNHTGQNFEYGESRLAFDGTELKSETLWAIVNDGEPDAEYYIGDKQVTQEEIFEYFEDNPKTKVEFSPLEVSWLNKISRYEAITLAENYWKDFDIEENGYRVELAVNSLAPDSVYVIIIKWFVADHYSTVDEIWIDKNTGDTIIPYGHDAKG